MNSLLRFSFSFFGFQLSMYFDQGAFMHHPLHILDAPVTSGSLIRIEFRIRILDYLMKEIKYNTPQLT